MNLSPPLVSHQSFQSRARYFIDELKKKSFPNAQTLAKTFGCSGNTAQRLIDRLRDEFLVPFQYDATERGYVLLDPDFELPATLPPGKDELVALLLAREFLEAVDASDISDHLNALWHQYASRNRGVRRELESLTKIFSCDSTMISDSADRGVVNLVTAAQSGESVKIVYKSPWSHTTEKEYQGRIRHVRVSDGTVYLLLEEPTGRECILNAAFLRSITILNHDLPKPPAGHTERTASNWRDGFGVWAGEGLEEIEVHIRPPAAEYYAAQRWHSGQRDEFVDGILIRRFSGHIAPDLIRKVMGLGAHLKWVEPEELRDQILVEIESMTKVLE